jgi:hypothetical protein
VQEGLVTIDFERRAALAELLAQPDPPELQRRGNQLRLVGKPERYSLLPLLSAVFVQEKLLALEHRRDICAPTDRRDILWGRSSTLGKEVLAA